MTDEQTKVTHTSAVVEELFCRHGLIGVRANLKNAEVMEIILTWYEERGGETSFSGWGRYRLPGGEEQLKDLHTVIVKILEQIRYKKDRKNLMLRTSMISPRE